MSTIDTMVKDYATQYDVLSILERIERLELLPEVKIGLLGEFSSGKTSLLNAVFGCELPVAINPTTKAVCLIEAKDGITSDSYALEDGDGVRSPVDFMDFSDIVAGEKVGASVAVVQHPSSDYFKQGMVFVDTPGVSSLNQAEADVTYRYLAFMDAAIICLPVSKGTITRSTIDFISDARLSHLTPHMYFVITKVDQRGNPEDVEAVKQAIVAQLEELPIFSGMAMAEKVLTFTTKSEDFSGIRGFIETHLVGNLPKLVQGRKEKEMLLIAQDLFEILSEKRSAMEFDDSKMKEKIEALIIDKTKIKELKEDKEESFYQAMDSLSSNLKNVMESYKGAITGGVAQGKDTADLVAQLAEDVNNLLVREVGALVSNFDITKVALSSGTFCSLERRLQACHERRKVVTEIATAVALAAVAPAVGVAGNAAEAGGAYAAQQFGKNTLKGVAKQGGCSVVRGLAEKLADGAEQTEITAKKPSVKKIATGFLSNVANFIDKVNPLEKISMLVEPLISEKMFDDEVQMIAANLSSRVINQVRATYMAEVIEPLEAELREKEKAIQDAREEKSKSIDAFIASRDTLTAVLKELKRVL